MKLTKRIREAIEVLRGFSKESQVYWIHNYKGLSDSEKGFLILWLGHGTVL